MNTYTLLSRLRFAGLAGLVLFAPDAGDGGGGGGGQGGSGDGGSGDDGKGVGSGSDDQGKGKGEPPAPAVQMSQEDFDALIDKRIGQARKGWEADLSKYTTAENESAEEKAKREAAEAKEQASSAQANANQVLIRAEATIQSGPLDIRTDRIKSALALADFDGIEVKDGKVDEKAVKAAMAKVLEEHPEFKNSKDQGTGSSTGTGNDNGGTPPPGPPKTMQEAIAARFEKESAASS